MRMRRGRLKEKTSDDAGGEKRSELAAKREAEGRDVLTEDENHGLDAGGQARAAAAPAAQAARAEAREAKLVGDSEMRARVAGEVDGMMDNGVRINPLLRDMYGTAAPTK